MTDLLTSCALPGCWVHRREADTMRKRTVARLALLREQVRRDEHLLAALGEGGAA